MSQPISLYILTDDAEAAARHVFRLPLAKLPSFFRVLTDWREIERLPENAPCLCFWVSPRDRPSLAETAWRERRREVRLDDNYQTWMDRCVAWRVRKYEADDAAERALLGYGEAPEPVAAMPAPPIEQPKPAVAKWR